MPVPREAMLELLDAIDVPRTAHKVAIRGGSPGFAKFSGRTFLDGISSAGERPRRRGEVIDRCQTLTGYPASRVAEIRLEPATISARVYALDGDGKRWIDPATGRYTAFWVFRPITDDIATEVAA